MDSQTDQGHSIYRRVVKMGWFYGSQGSFKVTENDTIQQLMYDFL